MGRSQYVSLLMSKSCKYREQNCLESQYQALVVIFQIPISIYSALKLKEASKSESMEINHLNRGIIMNLNVDILRKWSQSLAWPLEILQLTSVGRFTGLKRFHRNDTKQKQVTWVSSELRLQSPEQAEERQVVLTDINVISWVCVTAVDNANPKVKLGPAVSASILWLHV